MRELSFGRMLERVADFIARHRMFETAQRIGVAVSGGADSIFLLHALHALAPRWNLHLSVIHIEHGIRGAASVEDAEFVRGLAARFALPFHLRVENVPAKGGNLEQAARNARHRLYGELVTAGTLDRIATGHTYNDQAETVLYRILRGSGLAGLSGILPVTSQGIVRPLLEIKRVEIETWLRGHGVEWHQDATNYDPSFARNRLRHETLPLLRETFNPRLDQALVHLSEVAQQEERYWNSELDRYRFSPAESPILRTLELTGVPVALGRRLIRRLIQQVKGDLRQIEFQHVESILKMAASPRGHCRIQIPGAEVLRSHDWLRFGQPGSILRQRRDFSLPISIPGSLELPGSGTRITLQLLEKQEGQEGCVKVVNDLDWQRVILGEEPPSTLELRNWKPGDQYRRVGRFTREKVKVLFQEAKVPLWERGNWPIITYNGSIIWVGRFGAAAEFAAGPGTRTILRVVESTSSSSNR